MGKLQNFFSPESIVFRSGGMLGDRADDLIIVPPRELSKITQLTLAILILSRYPGIECNAHECPN